MLHSCVVAHSIFRGKAHEVNQRQARHSHQICQNQKYTGTQFAAVAVPCRTLPTCCSLSSAGMKEHNNDSADSMHSIHNQRSNAAHQQDLRRCRQLNFAFEYSHCGDNVVTQQRTKRPDDTHVSKTIKEHAAFRRAWACTHPQSVGRERVSHDSHENIQKKRGARIKNSELPPTTARLPKSSRAIPAMTRQSPGSKREKAGKSLK